jgi:putative oxidoreductase
MNKTLRDVSYAILRVGTALLFIEHGLQKVFGWMGGFGGPGLPAPLMSRFGFAGYLELVGGVLLIVGFLTRPVAALLLIEMIVAFFLAHYPRGGWPVQNIGEIPLFYACVFAFLAAHGAGTFSVDEMMAGRPAARV